MGEDQDRNEKADTPNAGLRGHHVGRIHDLDGSDQQSPVAEDPQMNEARHEEERPCAEREVVAVIGPHGGQTEERHDQSAGSDDLVAGHPLRIGRRVGVALRDEAVGLDGEHAVSDQFAGFSFEDDDRALGDLVTDVLVDEEHVPDAQHRFHRARGDDHRRPSSDRCPEQHPAAKKESQIQKQPEGHLGGRHDDLARKVRDHLHVHGRASKTITKVVIRP